MKNFDPLLIAGKNELNVVTNNDYFFDFHRDSFRGSFSGR